ncbi:hypothetical protein D3C73_1031910 [compost metagenome]
MVGRDRLGGLESNRDLQAERLVFFTLPRIQLTVATGRRGVLELIDVRIGRVGLEQGSD